MSTLKDFAMTYEGGTRTKNIAELSEVPTSLVIQSKELKDREGTAFTLHYIEVNGEHYRVPISVISHLRLILEENPNLQKFKVRKTGEGLGTEYTVIPLS